MHVISFERPLSLADLPVVRGDLAGVASRTLHDLSDAYVEATAERDALAVQVEALVARRDQERDALERPLAAAHQRAARARLARTFTRLDAAEVELDAAERRAWQARRALELFVEVTA